MFSGVMNGTQSTGDESNDIQLLEYTIPPRPLPLSQRSRLNLLLLYFLNIVHWISPKFLTVFLTV